MKINLCRIDDRLIHGQVATVWAKEANAERIIVCSDEVAKDDIRKTLLLQVGPPGIKVSVVDIAKAIRVYNNPKYENDTVFLLFTCPQDVLSRFYCLWLPDGFPALRLSHAFCGKHPYRFHPQTQLL